MAAPMTIRRNEPSGHVEEQRNWMGGPRRRWAWYSDALGLIGVGILLTVGFAVLALLVNPWFWLGAVLLIAWGTIAAVWMRRRGYTRWERGNSK
jgi:hypothetical protein